MKFHFIVFHSNKKLGFRNLPVSSDDLLDKISLVLVDPFCEKKLTYSIKCRKLFSKIIITRNFQGDLFSLNNTFFFVKTFLCISITCYSEAPATESKYVFISSTFFCNFNSCSKVLSLKPILYTC